MDADHAYEMVAVGEPLRATRRPRQRLAADEVRIEVAGCGVCHTDLGFLYDGVRTRHPLPLVLGHEISGFVIETGADVGRWHGQAVVVPAVLPCGACDRCLAGRPMTCAHQVMPGNDRDGGFASHVVLPAAGLCPVPGVHSPDQVLTDDGLTLRHLSVIADAVSTPYQALRRTGIKAGDVVIVLGLGGVGGSAARLATALGAHVVGIDVDPAKATGDLFLDPRSASPRELRTQIRGWARERHAPDHGWIIVECSGTAAGQATAYGLLVHGATLCVVGYTRDEVPIRLSNLMAFDARAIGNWGCDPALYPEIVQLALSGQLGLTAHTELRPLHSIQAAFDDVRAHRVASRLVLTP